MITNKGQELFNKVYDDLTDGEKKMIFQEQNVEPTLKCRNTTHVISNAESSDQYSIGDKRYASVKSDGPVMCQCQEEKPKTVFFGRATGKSTELAKKILADLNEYLVFEKTLTAAAEKSK